MDKVNATKVVRYAYFLAFCLFLISGYISHNILLLGISITVLGGLLGGAQGALLPLAAMSYPSFCRGVGVAWMQGIGRTGAIIGAFFGSFIFSFDLALSEVFYLLSIPACIAAILLTLKVFYESSSHKSKQVLTKLD